MLKAYVSLEFRTSKNPLPVDLAMPYQLFFKIIFLIREHIFLFVKSLFWLYWVFIAVWAFL